MPREDWTYYTDNVLGEYLSNHWSLYLCIRHHTPCNLMLSVRVSDIVNTKTILSFFYIFPLQYGRHWARSECGDAAFSKYLTMFFFFFFLFVFFIVINLDWPVNSSYQSCFSFNINNNPGCLSQSGTRYHLDLLTFSVIGVLPTHIPPQIIYFLKDIWSFECIYLLVDSSQEVYLAFRCPLVKILFQESNSNFFLLNSLSLSF